MKYTVNQAATIVGTTRQTIYRHIEKKPISTELDSNGNQLIDASELLRVYGDNLDFGIIDREPDTNVTVNVTSDKTGSDKKEYNDISYLKLEMEVDKLKELIQKSEKENEYIKELLEDEREERKKATLLLTDKRERSDNSSDWQKSIKALEQRIANQEKTAKEKADREERILRQNLALKRALEAERKKNEEARRREEKDRNKSWLQKLFG